MSCDPEAGPASAQGLCPAGRHVELTFARWSIWRWPSAQTDCDRQSCQQHRSSYSKIPFCFQFLQCCSTLSSTVLAECCKISVNLTIASTLQTADSAHTAKRSCCGEFERSKQASAEKRCMGSLQFVQLLTGCTTVQQQSSIDLLIQNLVLSLTASRIQGFLSK